MVLVGEKLFVFFVWFVVNNFPPSTIYHHPPTTRVFFVVNNLRMACVLLPDPLRRYGARTTMFDKTLDIGTG